MQKTIGLAVGKIILSGEYAVVFGYPGIAVPAPFTVTATFYATPHDTLTITYSGIDNEAYLHRILAEVQKHTGPYLIGRQALHGHLTIKNTIPIGRGMGSSTALVIAICRCLLGHIPLPFKGEDKGEGYKQIALSIENAVNPGHSGLDFEVIWNEQPLLFQKGKPPQLLGTTINRLIVILSSAVLIDTGNPKEMTAELIAWVKENSLSLRERARVRGATQAIAHCTERLLAGESPFTVFPDHHRAQVALGVVPKPVQDLIAEIESSGGVAKVIGAGGRSSEGMKIPSEARSAEPRGGGGMVLALHQNTEKLLTIAQQHNMLPLTLTRPHPPLRSRS